MASTQQKVYSYHLPTGSTFYRVFFSPLCDKLVANFCPLWVHPDTLTRIGMLCTIGAYYSVFYYNNFILAAVLHLLYGILDNMDGKQSRRRGIQSAGGEFLDHCCDTLTGSLCYFYFSYALSGSPQVTLWLPKLLIVIQSILWSSHWYHKQTGSFPLGLCDGVTVDEFNAIYCPLLLFARGCGMLNSLDTISYYGLTNGELAYFGWNIFMTVTLPPFLAGPLMSGNYKTPFISIAILLIHFVIVFFQSNGVVSAFAFAFIASEFLSMRFYGTVLYSWSSLAIFMEFTVSPFVCPMLSYITGLECEFLKQVCIVIFGILLLIMMTYTAADLRVKIIKEK